MRRNPSMEKFINSQVRYWQHQKQKIDKPEKKIIPFVTISREYGCGGFEIGAKLAEIINDEYKPNPLWAPYDKELLDNIMKDLGLSLSLTETLTKKARNTMTNLIQTTFSKFPPQIAVYLKLVETIRLLAINGNVIIVGRAGNVITKDLKGGYHVRLVASLESRISRIKSILKISKKEAEKFIIDRSNDRENFINEYVKFDLTDPHNYHLFINTSLHTQEEVARIIIDGMKIKGLL